MQKSITLRRLNQLRSANRYKDVVLPVKPTLLTNALSKDLEDFGQMVTCGAALQPPDLEHPRRRLPGAADVRPRDRLTR